MASNKIRDIVVKTGEYTDRNTGQTKGRYKNVGALMQSDTEGKPLFIMLDRTFNPAGVTNPDGRESVLLSCFVPQDRQQTGGASGSNGGDPGPQPDDSRPGYDDPDSVPF